MSGRDAGSPAVLRLDGVRVRAETAAVEAFRAACLDDRVDGLGADGLPATYPFRWLTLPQVRPSLSAMLGGEGVLPVHEGQSFSYERALRRDADYRLDFEFRRTSAPERLTVSCAIFEGEEPAPCAGFETVLRLVDAGRA
ncbi:hypothetical protein [Methylocella sp.]|uniref:hypothetical protein n=1 Tax=Methylocella sp. TaxID=1978226 RepID=UPI0035B0D1AD